MTQRSESPRGAMDMSEQGARTGRPLTTKQEMFVQEYLIDLNATQAAIRAGYSQRTAGEIGRQLLAKTGVAARVREAKEERIDRIQIKQDEVLSELLILLKSSVEHYTYTEDGTLALKEGAPQDALRAVSGVKRRVKRYIEGKGENAEPVEVEEVEYRLWDKPACVNMAGKHLGLFPNRLQHEGKDGKDLPPAVLILPAAVDSEEWARAAKRSQAELPASGHDDSKDS